MRCFHRSIRGGESLPRWYPTFPHGLPSIGLLLLRATIGSRLIFEGSGFMVDAHGLNLEIWALGAVAAGLGICFVIGFLTPLAAGVSVLAEAAVNLGTRHGQRGFWVFQLSTRSWLRSRSFCWDPVRSPWMPTSLAGVRSSFHELPGRK